MNGRFSLPPGHKLSRHYNVTPPEQIILLLRKGERHEDGFAVIPAPADAYDFRGGSFLFINAPNLPECGVIGGRNFALKPGQRRMSQFCRTRGNDREA